MAFDEPVQTKGLKLKLESGTPISTWRMENSDSMLVVALGATPPAEDELTIEGIRDRAQHPNTMPAREVRIGASVWPVSRDGLVFLWETGDRPNLVTNPETAKSRTYRVKARGSARLNHHYAMELAGGAYLAEDADEAMLKACGKTGELSIEAVLLPANVAQGGPARIITFSSDSGSRNVTIGQEKDMLVLRLRTPATGPNGTNPEVPLCSLKADKKTHVVVTYKPGLIVCYQDGKQVLSTDGVTGDFSNWSPHHLLFGDEWNGGRDWSGTLESIAVYNRALGAEEAELNAAACRDRLLVRTSVPKYRVEAKLLAKSELPTLKQIAPYREALVSHEYEVASVRSVDPAGERTHTDGEGALPLVASRIRVVNWAILDGQTLPTAGIPTGSRVRSIIEPFDQNPQLERYYRSDTLEEDYEIPLFFAVSASKVVAPPPSTRQLIDGLEGYATWNVEPWADPVDDVSVKRTEDRGDVLRIRFSPGKHGKAALSRPLEMDLSKAGRLLFDVRYTGAKPISISCAFWTMPGRQFFESPKSNLPPGDWQHDVEIDLQSATFKSAATDWKYRTGLQNRDRTVQLTFMINYGDAEKGTVSIDRARCDPEPRVQ